MNFFRAWEEKRRQRLITLAMPTLAAMCRDPQMAECWGRSVDRLFLDGGSIRGFQAGVKLGWMEWCLDRDRRRLVMERESFGRLTDEGRRAWADRAASV